MSTRLNRGDTILCPLCGKPQEDKVEDFVVPGKIGRTSEAEEECAYCNASFTVTCVAPDRYEVLAI